MNWTSAILWGFLATVVQTIIEASGRGLGLTRMGLPFMLGTMLSESRDRAYLLGFIVHISVGWGVALVYAAIFEAWGRATWYGGAALGAVHGLFVLAVILPIMPVVHPRMAGHFQGPAPTPMLEPPGFLALNYGRNTTLVTLAAHTMYGIVLGLWYEPVLVG